ncbi:MAG TPA: hypothetical protein VK772_18580 [Puia sp.]|jgi:hypothetical protein|nr:hypothetical protein [Puia sp.]
MTSQKKREFLNQVYVAIISALVSATLTSAVVIYTFKKQMTEIEKQYNADEKFRLNENLNKILDINLQFPFLEDSTYISRWDRIQNPFNDSSLRYQTYCEYVFNFAENVSEYYKYDIVKINSFIDLEDLIGPHKSYWESQDVQKSYPSEFRDFINMSYKYFDGK